MKPVSLFKIGTLALFVTSGLVTSGVVTSNNANATGMVPETSVIIVEQGEGEGAINIKNTDASPMLLLTTLQNTKDDNESLLTVTPPAARVEPGKNQRVRFIMTTQEPLKTERLKRVVFEGVPPQQKNKSEVRMTVSQNLPVIIRPAGLEKEREPWTRLVWKQEGNSLTVSNPSPYVVRLSQGVQTLPDKTNWTLPNTYVLPEQTFTITPDGNKKAGAAQQVHISPATTWGYSVKSYDAPLSY
ncbi:MAG: fimbria/pilus periplasmic chaperone [Enterobacteriaceae bacterium]|jgi:P pilus assembly chaperone PapD|nr:fimbria/pilus periplasmic chaperone [Enterobacteriaceae bacterium]